MHQLYEETVYPYYSYAKWQPVKVAHGFHFASNLSRQTFVLRSRMQIQGVWFNTTPWGVRLHKLSGLPKPMWRTVFGARRRHMRFVFGVEISPPNFSEPDWKNAPIKNPTPLYSSGKQFVPTQHDRHVFSSRNFGTKPGEKTWKALELWEEHKQALQIYMVWRKEVMHRQWLVDEARTGFVPKSFRRDDYLEYCIDRLECAKVQREMWRSITRYARQDMEQFNLESAFTVRNPMNANGDKNGAKRKYTGTKQIEKINSHSTARINYI